jgi:hypothetical protein
VLEREYRVEMGYGDILSEYSWVST